MSQKRKLSKLLEIECLKMFCMCKNENRLTCKNRMPKLPLCMCKEGNPKISKYNFFDDVLVVLCFFLSGKKVISLATSEFYHAKRSLDKIHWSIKGLLVNRFSKIRKKKTVFKDGVRSVRVLYDTPLSFKVF